MAHIIGAFGTKQVIVEVVVVCLRQLSDIKNNNDYVRLSASENSTSICSTEFHFLEGTGFEVLNLWMFTR